MILFAVREISPPNSLPAKEWQAAVVGLDFSKPSAQLRISLPEAACPIQWKKHQHISSASHLSYFVAKQA